MLNKLELQQVLDKLTAANNEAYTQRGILHDHCMEVYGHDPADIDNEDFIDKCDGGNGMSIPMTVEEFDLSMAEALKYAG